MVAKGNKCSSLYLLEAGVIGSIINAGEKGLTILAKRNLLSR